MSFDKGFHSHKYWEGTFKNMQLKRNDSAKPYKTVSKSSLFKHLENLRDYCIQNWGQVWGDKKILFKGMIIS